MRGFFVTGTDTGVGKTAVAAALLWLLTRRGWRAAPVKPVETGLAPGESGDLELCLATAGLEPPPAELELMRPCRFRLAASPHLAAEQEDREVDPSPAGDGLPRAGRALRPLVVEGAGGLLVPLTRHFLTIDLAARLGLPLVVVARAGLGTINHTLLTLRAARSAGLAVAAVVLNRAQPVEDRPEARRLERDNRRVIAELGGVTVLGPLPHLPGAGKLPAATRELADFLEQEPGAEQLLAR